MRGEGGDEPVYVHYTCTSLISNQNPTFVSITGSPVGVIIHVPFQPTRFLSNGKDGWILPSLSTHDSPDKIG